MVGVVIVMVMAIIMEVVMLTPRGCNATSSKRTKFFCFGGVFLETGKPFPAAEEGARSADRGPFL